MDPLQIIKDKQQKANTTYAENNTKHALIYEARVRLFKPIFDTVGALRNKRLRGQPRTLENCITHMCPVCVGFNKMNLCSFMLEAKVDDWGTAYLQHTIIVVNHQTEIVSLEEAIEILTSNLAHILVDI